MAGSATFTIVASNVIMAKPRQIATSAIAGRVDVESLSLVVIYPVNRRNISAITDASAFHRRALAGGDQARRRNSFAMIAVTISQKIAAMP